MDRNQRYQIQEIYIYFCWKTEFKFRFYHHRQTFKNKLKRYTTELSKAFWEAIDNGETLMLNGAFRPDLVPINPVPPGVISASMHLAHLTNERNSPASVTRKTNLNQKTSRNLHQASNSVFYHLQFFSFLISHDFCKFIPRHLSMTKNFLTFAQLRLLLFYLYTI